MRVDLFVDYFEQCLPVNTLSKQLFTPLKVNSMIHFAYNLYCPISNKEYRTVARNNTEKCQQTLKSVNKH